MMRTLLATTLALMIPALCFAFDVSSTPSVAEYTKLRLAYASESGTIQWSSHEERKAFQAAYRAGDVDKAIELGNAWIQKTPVDSEAFLMLAMCYKERGDLGAYCRYIFHFYGLLRSITDSGDGLTPETAFKVISIDEEYALLREVGAKVKRQSLVAGHIDKMEVERREDLQYVFYFDASIALDQWKKQLKGN